MNFIITNKPESVVYGLRLYLVRCTSMDGISHQYLAIERDSLRAVKLVKKRFENFVGNCWTTFAAASLPFELDMGNGYRETISVLTEPKIYAIYNNAYSYWSKL